MLKKIIIDWINLISFQGVYVNERYLHHSLSHFLQSKNYVLDLSRAIDCIKLHPEWPTWKNSCSDKVNYAKYKKDAKGKYCKDSSGTSGFIDFALGDYESPNAAIELTSKRSLCYEGIAFDFLKLLDVKRPFKQVFSINYIFRDKGLPAKGNRQRFHCRISSLVPDILNREIKIGCQDTFFVIIEIAEKTKRFWTWNDDVWESYNNKLPNY